MSMCALLALNMIQLQEMTNSVPKCQLHSSMLVKVLLQHFGNMKWVIILTLTLSFYIICPMKSRTLFPVTRCHVIEDLNAVGLPGLNPTSTQ